MTCLIEQCHMISQLFVLAHLQMQSAKKCPSPVPASSSSHSELRHLQPFIFVSLYPWWQIRFLFLQFKGIFVPCRTARQKPWFVWGVYGIQTTVKAATVSQIIHLQQKVSASRLSSSTCLLTENPRSTLTWPCDSSNNCFMTNHSWAWSSPLAKKPWNRLSTVLLLSKEKQTCEWIQLRQETCYTAVWLDQLLLQPHGQPH